MERNISFSHHPWDGGCKSFQFRSVSCLCQQSNEGNSSNHGSLWVLPCAVCMSGCTRWENMFASFHSGQPHRPNEWVLAFVWANKEVQNRHKQGDHQLVEAPCSLPACLPLCEDENSFVMQQQWGEFNKSYLYITLHRISERDELFSDGTGLVWSRC